MTGRLYRGSLHLTIPLVDELELRWFYSSPALSFDGCMGGGSSLGKQLEIAELFSFHTVTCKRCRGRGFLCVATVLKRRDQTRMKEYMKLLELYEADEKLPPAMDTFCADCSGTGYVSRPGRSKPRGRVTARQSQTASPGASPASTEGPNLEQKDRFRRVEARVLTFRREHLRHEHILSLFLEPGSSEEAIWPFTDAGLDWLRLSPEVRHSPSERVSLIRDAANQQAQDELAQVSESWRRIMRPLQQQRV